MSQDKLRFRCHHCHGRLKIAPEYAGHRIDCPKCGGQVLVPDSREAHVATDVSALSSVAETTGEEPIRFAKAGGPVEDEGPDMTPMVDVVFQLLIFFMVTAAFAKQKSLQVPTPDQQQTAAQARTLREFEEDNDFIIVKIDSDNVIWVDNEEAPSQQELLARLRDARQGQGGGKGPTNLLVLASPEARHEKVVMALDAGNAVGMQQVRLAQMNEDDS